MTPLSPGTNTTVENDEIIKRLEAALEVPTEVMNEFHNTNLALIMEHNRTLNGRGTLNDEEFNSKMESIAYRILEVSIMMKQTYNRAFFIVDVLKRKLNGEVPAYQQQTDE